MCFEHATNHETSLKPVVAPIDIFVAYRSAAHHKQTNTSQGITSKQTRTHTHARRPECACTLT